mgnify:CR=1 FL=1
MKASNRARVNHGLLPVVLCILLGCNGPGPAGPRVEILLKNGDSLLVPVEVAATKKKRELGLMYRNELPETHGMFFIFPKETTLSFWMKNTPLPLDIVFINSKFQIVHVAKNTVPYSTARISSLHPAKYVLEVNGGFCERKGVVRGATVHVRNISLPL